MLYGCDGKRVEGRHFWTLTIMMIVCMLMFFPLARMQDLPTDDTNASTEAGEGHSGETGDLPPDDLTSEKQSIFKKVWFWCVIVLVIVLLIGLVIVFCCCCGKGKKGSSKKSSTKKRKNSKRGSRTGKKSRRSRK